MKNRTEQLTEARTNRAAALEASKVGTRTARRDATADWEFWDNKVAFLSAWLDREPEVAA